MDNAAFIGQLKNGGDIEPDENVFHAVWNEYERVILQSLVTSFGLDGLIHDQRGGDVDTIYNVRHEKDENGAVFKNASNKAAYDNRGKYDTAAYHSDSRYRSIVNKARKEFDENGKTIDDAYVPGNKVIPRGNSTIPRGKQGQLDHVVSAENIHNDPGRILAGLDGKELANCPENLRYTNAALNRNMSKMSVDEYIEWCEKHPDQVNYNGKKGEPLPESVKKRLRSEYDRAKSEYDAKLAKAYYTSPKFMKDTAKAAGKVGVQMGIRQALGFVFVEVYFGAKEELQTVPAGSSLSDMFEAVGRGIRKGFDNAREKRKELIAKIEEGFTAGALSSLTTTICNIFFTTAKNLVRCIRQIYASVVQAGKVLLFNPDNLMLGDRIKTATVIMATCASVLVGTAVGDLISKTPLGMAPGIGQICTVFCSSLVSGLISCTLLVFLDRSRLMNSIIDCLNAIPTEIGNFAVIADAMEELAAKLEKIDIEKFREDTEKYRETALQIRQCEDEEQLNRLLSSAYQKLGIKIPWEGDFDSFMGNRSNRLVFE